MFSVLHLWWEEVFEKSCFLFYIFGGKRYEGVVSFNGVLPEDADSLHRNVERVDVFSAFPSMIETEPNDGE